MKFGEVFKLIDALNQGACLSIFEYKFLLDNYSQETADYLKKLAQIKTHEIYGNKIFVRGLIEISNFCKNNCFYCGIRRDNNFCSRYRLTKAQILQSCDEGYKLGLRTFVLQGGEDNWFSDNFLCDLICEIKNKHQDCAVTLSLGERSRESYENLFSAGADRYLLRHETFDEKHYEFLHPKEMSFSNRIRCLHDLKEIGYQVGCGFMVGSPKQTTLNLAKDLKFVEEFSPDMCGIGPFIPHKETPMKNDKPGSVDLTCYIISVLRLIKPNMLIPATTALASLDPSGREKGILAGANVVMPNLSPFSVRAKYSLYNNKAYTDKESAQNKEKLVRQLGSIGYELTVSRGDIKNK